MGKSSKKPVKRPARASASSIGKRIQAGRLALSLTQEEMAGIFDVDKMTISRWERDVFPPQSAPAILMSLEYLKMQRLLDHDELLRSVEQRRAELDAFGALLEKESAAFNQPKKK